MPALRAFLLCLASVAVLGCGDSQIVEQAEQPEPEAAAEDACPQWLLVERTGELRYERRFHDELARVVRWEHGGPARSRSGEFHSLTEFNYEDGLVTLESEGRDSLGQETVERFTEVTELDALGRPSRILGWDVPESPTPNRTVTQEYNQPGQLSVQHQQDEYGNGATVDRRCTFEYDSEGRLLAKPCKGTHPDIRRYGWDEDGNLLFSELETESFTSRAEYTYDGRRLSSVLSGDFSRDDFAYDTDGRLAWHEYQRFDGLGDGRDEFAYDDQGKMIQHVSQRLDGSSRNVTSFRYDSDGRLIEASSDLTPRSFRYERSGNELEVTERWGDDLFETRRYQCSPTPTTGMPVDTNPEPFGGRDRILPHQTATPLPFPDRR